MKKLLLLCLSLLALNSCQDPLSDLNKDIKAPTEIEASTLVANASVELFNYMASINLNRNPLRFWAQYFAQVQYPEASNYDLNSRNINGNTWNKMYAIIRDAKNAQAIIEADDLLRANLANNQWATAELIQIWAYHYLVDYFGDVPYTTALGNDLTPTYDQDETIYADLIKRLDLAIDKLGGPSGWGSSDLIYGGDSDAWKKMANSLKLKLAIRMADTDDALATRMAQEAVASGILTDNSDNFQLNYSLSDFPNINTYWYDFTSGHRSTNYVLSSTLVDLMNGLEDPRRPVYFSNPIYNPQTNEWEWIGGTYGTQNVFSGNSQPGDTLFDPERPSVLLDYTEVLFLLADAKARGYEVGASSAADYYYAAITNSIVEWTGEDSSVAEYITQADVAYRADNWKWCIGTQKWLALYNRSLEPWATYRLYDAPKLVSAAAAGILPPRRYTYPLSEFSVNEESINAAIGAMGGMDDWFHPIFWDKN